VNGWTLLLVGRLESIINSGSGSLGLFLEKKKFQKILPIKLGKTYQTLIGPMRMMRMMRMIRMMRTMRIRPIKL
jgi:hypothetical protein